MDLYSRFRTHWSQLHFSERIRSVPKKCFKIFDKRSANFQKWSGGLALLTALLLGGWAHEKDTADAIAGWKQKQAPSVKIVTHALSSFGFTEMTDPKKANSLLRSAPMTADPDASIWIDEEFRAVLVFQKGESGQAPLLFVDSPIKSAKGWCSLGTGWDGFQSLLQKLESRRAGPAQKPVMNRKGILVDARQIRY